MIYELRRNTRTRSLLDHVFFVFLCLRFTAAEQLQDGREPSLCFHHRQEERRKLNEVSPEDYVNGKRLFHQPAEKKREGADA